MLTLELLLRAFRIQDEQQPLNLYQTGSRVYGTYKQSSDWDFFLVVSDDYFNKWDDAHRKNENGHLLLFKDWQNQFAVGYKCLYMTVVGDERDHASEYSVNINLYKHSVFKEKVHSHWLQALMCIYLPDEFIWRHDFGDLHKSNITIMYRKMSFSVIGEAGKHFQMARRKWGLCTTEDGDGSIEGDDAQIPHYLEKKYIIHAFRDILLGIQLAKYEAIVDYHCANPIYYEVMSNEATDWKVYQKIFYPRYQKLKDEFNSLANKSHIVFPDRKLDKSQPNVTLQFMNDLCTRELEEIGISVSKSQMLSKLSKYFSIRVTPHFSIPNAYHLSADPNESPSFSPIVHECNGMVLQEINEDLTLLCAPPLQILAYNNHFAPKVTYRKCRVVDQCIAGHYIIYLFFYENQWITSSSDTSDLTKHVLKHIHSQSTTTLNELFWMSMKDMLPIDPTKTYVFELITNEFINVNDPDFYNLLVTRNTPCFNLYSILDKSLFREEEIHLDQTYFTNCTQQLSKRCISPLSSSVFSGSAEITFNNLDEVQTYCQTLSPLDVSSCVVCDSRFNRLQVPCPQFDSLSSLMQSQFSTVDSNDQMLDVVRSVFANETHLAATREFFHNPLIPTFLTDLYDQTVTKYAQLCHILQLWYEQISHLDQKAMVDNVMGQLDIHPFRTEAAEHEFRENVVSVFTSIIKGKRNVPTAHPSPSLTVKELFSLSHARGVLPFYNRL